jgi:hypothetical protein
MNAKPVLSLIATAHLALASPGAIYDLLIGVGGFGVGAVWTVGEAHIETLVLRTRDR